MTRNEAEKLSIALMQIIGILDQTAAYVRDKDDEASFDRYRRSVGKIMGYMFMELEQPIWDRFPELEPEAMGGPYKVDPAIYEPLFYEDYRNGSGSDD
jgi:hypothetical protein